MTALRLGADLVHIFCERSAGTAIKCYSPDLIVHPILDDEDNISQVTTWFDRLHSVVIGPGLGRNHKTLHTVQLLIEYLKESKKLVVVDGDGLFLITQNPELIHGCKNFVLTPNIAELSRLTEKLNVRGNDEKHTIQTIAKLSEELGGVTIVAKGPMDIISNATLTTTVHQEGCPRRCGGQGDFLAGSVGLLGHWASSSEGSSVPQDERLLLGAYTACVFTRHLAYDTFHDEKALNNHRSMLASDMVLNVGRSFRQLEQEWLMESTTVSSLSIE